MDFKAAMPSSYKENEGGEKEDHPQDSHRPDVLSKYKFIRFCHN